MDGAKQQYVVGVDTGGTYTDAAIVDSQTRRVIASAKALTTKGNLAIGVTEAISAAVGNMPASIDPSDITLVSVSTTLATNAVVEGHGDAVGVVLIGFDDGMAQRTGIQKSFSDMPIIRIEGGHSHTGDQVAPLDVETLEREVLAVDSRVSAYSVAGSFAVRNPGHEQRAQQIISALTNKPVTLSTEISSELDSPRRAMTGALNARLIGRIALLVAAVRTSMKTLDIACPLMLVKGDGSLALADSVAQRPIETVLSGPAASMVGAQWLSGEDTFLLSDIGGTTTDLGIMAAGRPTVLEKGATVGGWRTMVKAIDLQTVGLGGDSEVSLNQRSVEIGPQRVVPLSLLAYRFPETLKQLKLEWLDSQNRGAAHARFALRPLGSDAPSDTSGLSPREREMLEVIAQGPTPLHKISGSATAQRTLQSLRRLGHIQIAAFTPSDAAHVLNLQANWDREAADYGARFGARLREMSNPSDEQVASFAVDVWNATVERTCHVVLDQLMGVSKGDSDVRNAICAGHPIVGHTEVSVHPSLPLVAVGGPAKIYYEEVGKRLNARVVFPEFGHVANAVGAATGPVRRQSKVTVEAVSTGTFRVHSTQGMQTYLDVSKALEAAVQTAESEARASLLAMGATNPSVSTSVDKLLIPGLKEDIGLVSATVIADAEGRPDGAELLRQVHRRPADTVDTLSTAPSIPCEES